MQAPQRRRGHSIIIDLAMSRNQRRAHLLGRVKLAWVNSRVFWLAFGNSLAVPAHMNQ
jgi:hypothetical protein